MNYKPTSENNFSWLLGALVLLLFCGALFTQFELHRAHFLVNLSLMVTVVIAVWSMNAVKSKWSIAKIILSIVILALMIVDSSIASHVLAPAQLIGMFVFLALTIYMAWRQVMFTGEVTRNTILGAVCIYILIGLWFGFAYMIVEHFSPGSLNGLEREHWQKNMGSVSYYSMVTLTTLGYGDITPVAPVTRFLAYMEAAIGVFYTTVLVASLIGLRLAGYNANSPK